ncbi:hypothetical protein CHKEEEPN_4175 [Methylorubrum podarium]|nr:hypothetical protein CHKEEEPN_4175 [Methylorubrum podarium]
MRSCVNSGRIRPFTKVHNSSVVSIDVHDEQIMVP